MPDDIKSSDTSFPASYPNVNNPKFEGEKNVRRAISTAQQAQSIADRLVLDDAGRDLRRAEVQRAINGAAPFSERALKEKNQGHRFNISCGYLEGACGRAMAPYYDLGLDEEFVAKIDADLDETKKNIIRDEFVKEVKKWGMWPHNYAALVRETVNFGYCSAVFLNKFSPWWIAVRQRDGLVFARQPNIARRLDVFVLKRSYLVHELYDYIENADAAKTAGWNIENVRVALMNAVPDDYVKNRLTGGWQIYEEAIRAAAFAASYGTGAKKVDTYHVYCQELTGKVSCWIVLDTTSQGGARVSGNSSEGNPDVQIELYKHLDQFDSFDEVLTRFDLEDGDGFWHGSKGLGQKLYNVHKAHDRLFNSGLDQVYRGGLGVLKSTSQKGHENMGLQVTSDFVVLSPEVDAVPGIKMPTISPEFFSMDAALLATAVQRGGDVAPEAMGVERAEKTATQSTYDQANKQVVTKANLKRWVAPLSQVIDTMLKRLLDAENGGELSKNFVNKLVEKGITPEDIQKIRRVQVLHSVEDVFGETKQSVSYISDKYRADPDVARMELKKKEIEVWLGPEASLQLVPGDADQLDALKASRLQTLEISSILDGNSVPVAPDDLHPVHLQTGVAYLNDAAQRLVQGATQDRRSPSQQDITNILAHLQQHVEFQGSVKGQREVARQMEDALKQAGDVIMQAFQINAAKHEQAFTAGVVLGAEEGTNAAPSSPAGGQSMPSSPPATPPTLPAELPTAMEAA